jgi:hypothetical protein
VKNRVSVVPGAVCSLDPLVHGHPQLGVRRTGLTVGEIGVRNEVAGDGDRNFGTHIFALPFADAALPSNILWGPMAPRSPSHETARPAASSPDRILAVASRRCISNRNLPAKSRRISYFKERPDYAHPGHRLVGTWELHQPDSDHSSS